MGEIAEDEMMMTKMRATMSAEHKESEPHLSQRASQSECNASEFSEDLHTYKCRLPVTLHIYAVHLHHVPKPFRFHFA